MRGGGGGGGELDTYVGCLSQVFPAGTLWVSHGKFEHIWKRVLPAKHTFRYNLQSRCVFGDWGLSSTYTGNCSMRASWLYKKFIQLQYRRAFSLILRGWTKKTLTCRISCNSSCFFLVKTSCGSLRHSLSSLNRQCATSLADTDMPWKTNVRVRLTESTSVTSRSRPTTFSRTPSISTICTLNTSTLVKISSQIR